jgi:hypothetical protein
VHVDLTKSLDLDKDKATVNTVAVNMEVYDTARKEFRPYVNTGGYQFDDQAIIDVAATVSIYDGTAVEAVKAQPHAYTGAEEAIRSGASTKLFTPPPDDLQSTEFGRTHSSFIESGADAEDGVIPFRQIGQQEFAAHPEALAVPIRTFSSDFTPASSMSQVNEHVQGDERINFEERTPWYQFQSDADTLVNDGAQPIIVSMFEGTFMNIDQRIAQTFVVPDSLPKEWRQVALHFTLSRPKGSLDYDHWDRIGSLGIVADSKQLAEHGDAVLNLIPSDAQAEGFLSKVSLSI